MEKNSYLASTSKWVDQRIINRSQFLGKDIDLKMDDDQIKLEVINPSRDKSGVYTVVLRNAQGEVRKDITVNILGMCL